MKVMFIFFFSAALYNPLFGNRKLGQDNKKSPLVTRAQKELKVRLHEAYSLDKKQIEESSKSESLQYHSVSLASLRPVSEEAS